VTWLRTKQSVVASETTGFHARMLGIAHEACADVVTTSCERTADKMDRGHLNAARSYPRRSRPNGSGLDGKMNWRPVLSNRGERTAMTNRVQYRKVWTLFCDCTEILIADLHEVAICVWLFARLAFSDGCDLVRAWSGLGAKAN
jgi:hypothetical protein